MVCVTGPSVALVILAVRSHLFYPLFLHNCYSRFKTGVRKSILQNILFYFLVTVKL